MTNEQLRRIKILKKGLLLLVLMSLSVATIAQTETVNSLRTKLKRAKSDTNKVILLNDLCWEYSFSQLDSSIIFGERAITLSEELNYSKGTIYANKFTGRSYSLAGKSEKGIRLLKKALLIATAKEEVSLLGGIENEIGNAYEAVSNYDEALYHLYKALRLFEKHHDDQGESYVKLNMANIYYYQDDYEETLRLSLDARRSLKKIGDEVTIGVSYFMSAQAYLELKQFDRARTNYELALGIYDENEAIGRKAEVLNALGVLYQEMEDYPKALEYYEKSLVIDDSLGNEFNTAISYANIAGVYTVLGELEKSIDYLAKSIEIAKKYNQLEFLMTTMNYYADTYYKEGSNKKAYEYRLIADQIRDSIYSENKSAQIIKIREQYNVEKKDQEVINLKNEKSILKAKTTLNYALFAASIVLLALVIVVVLLFQSRRKSKEEKRRWELEQKALRSQMNPHFIFNSLNSIQRMFIEGDQDKANDYMGDFSSLLRIILENSGKSKISLKDEIDTLKLYLELEIMRTGGIINYTIDVDSLVDIQNNFVPPLIIQPFVENAIWHGILPKEEKGMISIQIEKHSADVLFCSIVDDGIGIDKSRKQKMPEMHNSKGMSLTKDRLGKENSVRAEELSAGGTKITLLIPLS